MLVKDKCWIHLGMKLTLEYSLIYVEEHYDFIDLLIKIYLWVIKYIFLYLIFLNNNLLIFIINRL